MEAWVFQANGPSQQLAGDIGNLGAVVQALDAPPTTTTTTTDPQDTAPSTSSTTTPPGTVPPTADNGSGATDPAPGYIYDLNVACSSLQTDLSKAQAVPAPPSATIHQDWVSMVSAYTAIATACTQAVSGSNATFPQSWTTLSASVGPPTVQLNADVNKAGYCFPSSTCPPPFTLAN